MKIKENINIYENVLNDHGHCVPSGQRKETWKIRNTSCIFNNI